MLLAGVWEGGALNTREGPVTLNKCSLASEGAEFLNPRGKLMTLIFLRVVHSEGLGSARWLRPSKLTN